MVLVVVQTLLGYVHLARCKGVRYAVATWVESDRLYNTYRAVYGREPEPDEWRILGKRCQSWRAAQGRSLSSEQIRRLVCINPSQR